MVPVWRDEYSVNNEDIDNQHKKLFALAMKVYKLSSQKISKHDISRVFKGLFNYMKEHFYLEEEYMKSIGYPKLQEHKKQHQEIIDEVTNILKNYHSIESIHEALKTTSKKWLTDHIIDHDFQYEKWRKNNQNNS